MLGRFALLLAAAALVAAACGNGAGADRSGTRQVGILRAFAAGPGQEGAEGAMFAELRRAGFVVGRNIDLLVESDDVYPDPEDAEAAVREWESDGVDLVVAFSTSVAAAARDAEGDAPILFIVNDPLSSGLVEDLARPEGRLTGVTFRVPADRTLDLAARVIPDLERVGMVFPSGDPAAQPHRTSVGEAADRVGLELETESFGEPDDLPRAVDVLAGAGVQALVLSTSPAAVRALPQLEAASQRHRLPVIANVDLATFALVSLYPDREAMGSQLGKQAIRLLRGDEVSSVPVEHPRRFDLSLNEAVASSYGITYPEAIIREADVVHR